VRLPLTLAILPALTVEQEGECYAIAQAHLLELVRLGGTNRLESAHDRRLYRLRGELLPVLCLGEALARAAADRTCGEPRHLLVLSADGRRFGLAVDRVRDTEEIVVKPLRLRLRENGPFAGATVRGDGRVALILDVPALADVAGLGRAESRVVPAAPTVPAEAPKHALLLVRSRAGAPVAVPVGDVERIVELESAAFERFGERAALRLEGGVLPLGVLAGDPPLDGPAALAGDRLWPVLLHGGAGTRRGVVVDAVEDIVEWSGAMDGDRIVLRDRVTDLVHLGTSDREAA